MRADAGLTVRTGPSSRRDGTGPPGAARCWSSGAVVAAAAAAAYLAALAAHPMDVHAQGLRPAGVPGRRRSRRCTSPANLYSWHYDGHPGIQFTYTPFAALLFAGGLALPFHGADGAGAGGRHVSRSAATVVDRVARAGLAGVPRAPARRCWSTGLAFWTEPVQRALFLGQVELVMMALIVWDLCQPDRRRLKGAATGVAAGIKLVPLLFIVYLLLTRRFRQAAVAGARVRRHGAHRVRRAAAAVRDLVARAVNFLQAAGPGSSATSRTSRCAACVTRLAGSVAGGQRRGWPSRSSSGSAGWPAAVAPAPRAAWPFAGLHGVRAHRAAGLADQLGPSLGVDRARRWRCSSTLGVRAASRRARARAWCALAGLVLVIYGAWPDFWSAGRRPAAGRADQLRPGRGVRARRQPRLRRIPLARPAAPGRQPVPARRPRPVRRPAAAASPPRPLRGT